MELEAKNDNEFITAIQKFTKIKKIAKPLIVAGKNSFEASGAKILFERAFEKKLTLFKDFTSNPTIVEINRGINEFENNSCDAVIAVGGGSSLDIGKSIALLSQQEKPSIDYVTKRRSISQTRVPLCLVPTTAGTGSETTQFSVVYINKSKYSLDHPSLLPDFAILYPKLTFSLSSQLTAITGSDALAQAMEAYWNINSNTTSDSFATKALELILNNLKQAVNNEPRARREMLRGSNLAGKAINITRTTAPHALSYFLTSYYTIPHGQAVVVTLPSFLEFNAGVSKVDTLDPRGWEYTIMKIQNIIKMLCANSINEAKDKLINFFRSINIKTSLSELNVPKDAVSIIIEHINFERMKNNPRKIEKQQLERLIGMLTY